MTESSESRRQQILAAAERLLGHYGPGKTTVADIAREAAVGVGTIYLEFPSKDAILVALSERRYEAILVAMADAGADGSTPGYGERLRRMMRARVDGFLAISADGAHAVDLVHCGACPAIRGAREDFERRERELVEGLLREACAAEEFACGDPRRSAGALLQALAAFAPPWVFGRAAVELHAELDALWELVVLGLARR
ncbi:MAG: TetR/AcrR family transcriptional regulator [Myxococcales bacterium]|nr:TetR/AcrR family transcriptional regulator [Myxococcales bacterium]